MICLLLMWGQIILLQIQRGGHIPELFLQRQHRQIRRVLNTEVAKISISFETYMFVLHFCGISYVMDRNTHLPPKKVHILIPPYTNLHGNIDFIHMIKLRIEMGRLFWVMVSPGEPNVIIRTLVRERRARVRIRGGDLMAEAVRDKAVWQWKRFQRDAGT